MIAAATPRPTRRARITIGAATLLVGLGAGLAPGARAAEPTITVVVRLDPDTTLEPQAALASVGGDLGIEYPQVAVDGFTARIPASQVEALRSVPGVIEVTTEVAVDTTPLSEPVALAADAATSAFVAGDFAHQESGPSHAALDLPALAEVTRADDAWRTTRGQGIDIALIDTGVAPVAGLGPVIDGPDVSFDAGDPNVAHLDGYGHGTHLAGIINGDTPGATGLAPGSRIVNVKAGSANGAVDVSQVIAAIDWVSQHRLDPGLNVRVLVLAFGTDGVQPYALDPLAHAVENAWRRGLVVVVAAGNAGQGTVSLNNPAIDPYVIAVGASETNGTVTTADDTLAPFTNRGSAVRGVDLVAPGRSIESLRVPGSRIDRDHPEGRVGEAGFRRSGTSQAAAVVGAAAALVLEDRPTLNPDQVKDLLVRTARPLPNTPDALQGGGVVDIARAVKRDARSVTTTRQLFPPSTGLGSLEAARGSLHVMAPDGTVLTGEQTVVGPWNGTSWSGTSWSGTSWSGGSWSGTSWSGTSWSGGSWSGTSWSGTSWSGTSWSGTSWSGTSWSGTSWSGTSWSGTSWSGTSWSGTSWSGTSWSAAGT
jgi:serine protease AprX